MLKHLWRTRIVIAWLAATLLLQLGCGRHEKPQYFIVILMDAVRPDHLGCYGYKRDTSPRIDRLAADGVVFENAIAEAPWTLPSIATILSSTFPCQHGAKRVEGANVGMKDREITFVELLAQAGYKTCAMSTAKIFNPNLGLSQGFDESIVVGKTGSVLEKVAAIELSDAAITWLRQNRGHKCFLFIHHYDTHYPYKAGEQCVSKFNPGYEGPYRMRFGDSSLRILKMARAGRLAEAVDLTDADVEQIKTLYDCEIVRTDKAIGNLVDSLSAWGCLKKSMILISADHGEEFLERGSLDHGQTVYDESIRVPLVIYGPRVVDETGRIDQQVGLIDFGPTILSAAGIEIPPEFEGASLLPHLSSRFKTQQEQLRPSGLPFSCLVSEAIAHRPEKKALRCPPWKLIYDPFFGARELYNLERDPGETENIIEVEAEVASDLTDILLTSLQTYYSGGWCIAWRNPEGKGTIRGNLELNSAMIEVVGHNLYPAFDPAVDSLTISHDRTRLSFGSMLEKRWEGVEVRMPSRQRATIDIVISGSGGFETLVGQTPRELTFPATLNPESAEVGRDQLHTLFRQDKADLVIFWIDPGSQPMARDEKQEELRRKLKAIGYID
ncbi:MAG: sulfatase [Candidatus Eisenbacteria bacterium]